jgi:hypothetical protein
MVKPLPWVIVIFPAVLLYIVTISSAANTLAGTVIPPVAETSEPLSPITKVPLAPVVGVAKDRNLSTKAVVAIDVFAVFSACVVPVAPELTVVVTVPALPTVKPD